MTDNYISNTLQSWYSRHKRDLPWRHTTDPYKIWISEIILQQTRVNQGLGYYQRFIERFPTVVSLASAHEDEVLKHWQGLGYYSRARNIHKTAQHIAEVYKGKFPTQHAEILKLKGIGDYTAAAISSFAFNQPYAVVDGNVFRVLSRLFGIETPIDTTAGKKEFAALAQQLIDKNEPAHHNQAVMEFGALQCVPVQPDCAVCPLQQVCKAYELDVVQVLPVKASKTKVRDRYFNYFDIKFNDQLFIQKRTAKDIWQNLYELPLIEADRLFELDEIPQLELFASTGFVEIEANPFTIKHILSHQRIYARFFSLRINSYPPFSNDLLAINRNELENYAISKLSSVYFDQK